MNTKVYAGRTKEKEVLQHCSSGGAFTVLSDVFLTAGNAVLCAGYNYQTHCTEFRLVFSQTERDLCRGSMYMQSCALDTWIQAEEWLKNNPDRELMFVGVGCQGAAFIKFCERKGLRERVTVVDIICHGVASPMIWKQYAQSIEKGGTLSEINFRDKRTGWNKSIGVAKLNGQEISLTKWRRVYSSRTILRPCCSSCPYTVIERQTDITIGDFWHLENSMPDFFDDMGTSVFLIHTEKGAALFEKAKAQIDYRESNTKDCWQLNLEKPTEHAENRQAFWTDYKRKGIDYVMEKYGTVTFMAKVKRKINNLMKFSGGYNLTEYPMAAYAYEERCAA